MAKLIGLHTRKGIHQLRVVVPLELRPLYGGKTKITRTLETKDRREASLIGTKRRAELLQEFQDQLRALNPQPVATIDPALGRLLGERIRATVLQNSQSLRETGGPLLSEIARLIPRPGARLTIGSYKAEPAPVMGSPLDGLSDEQLEVLTGLNATANDIAASQLAGHRLSSVVQLADTEAKKLGLLIDWNTPEARPVLYECLKAYRIAREDVTRVDAGQVLPPTAEQAAPVRSLTLRQVFDRWKPSKPRKAASTRACELALELFEKQHGNLPVNQINRDQGDAFRTWLQQQGSSSKTASDRFTWVKTLLTYADRDLGLIPRNPWHRLALANQTESRRRPWKPDELRAFFGLPLFTAYAIPPAARAGADAAYWIPLLGLFTGATVSELAQLRCEDIRSDALGSTLRITDEGENMSTKNEHRVREIPIHSELVRLGFLEYATAVKNSGSTSLWPALPLRKDKPGGYFSEWFGEIRKAPPLNFGRHPDFHCLRHTARTALAEAGFADSVKDRITGHSVRGSDGTKVYEHPIEILRKAVEAIRYPWLDLPKVYEHPTLKPTRKRRLTQPK